MKTTPIIESLSRSLDHWQFLYVLAITVALLSTFAIVVFAFHIEKHRTGLRVSNYIYVFASVIAVVATIVIVSKTRSLDAEKDRSAAIEISHAQANAADSLEKAVAAQLDIDKLKPTVNALETSQSATEQTVSTLQHSATPRHTEIDRALANRLRAFPNVIVYIVCDMGNSETCGLQGDIEAELRGGGVGLLQTEVMGPPAQSPLLTPGVHIRYEDDPIATKVANEIAKFLNNNHIFCDLKAGPYAEAMELSMAPQDAHKLSVFIGRKP